MSEGNRQVDILIVESDPAALAHYAEAIAPLGERLLTASQPAGALQLLGQNDIAVLLVGNLQRGAGVRKLADLAISRSGSRAMSILLLSAAPLAGTAWTGEPSGYVDAIAPAAAPEVLRARVGAAAVLQRRIRALERQLQEQAEESRCREQEFRAHVEAALRESERLAAMGRVAGIIAHEINNPLSAVTNILYLLQTNPSLDAEAHHYADAAEKELARVAHITRQTLSFYREARQPVPIRLEELLDDVVELQKYAFAASRIAVDKRYRAAASVNGFPGELRQVFLNLVANAIQAMPEGGTLRLRIREVTDWQTGLRGLAVSVIDTGVGIRKEDTARLFEPFFSTKAAKGTGLGLWISRDILHRYNGRISCRSHCVGGKYCTCFRVFIPAGPALQPEPAAPARDASGSAAPAAASAVETSLGGGGNLAAASPLPATLLPCSG